MRLQDCFNFAKLKAVSPYFYLMVAAAREIVITVLAQSRKISSTVGSGNTVQSRSCREVGPLPVSDECNGANHTYLPNLSNSHVRSITIAEMELITIIWFAYGDYFSI